jgi:dihydrofolate reductase
MRIALIAAVARNGVIGRAGALPWRLPDDMKQFKARTIDHAVIMGRKTWESLPAPLARRRNIVITRQPGYAAEGAIVVGSMAEALREAGDEAWVIGGAEIYAAALEHADTLVITHVDADVEGDAYFPQIDWTSWRAVSEEAHAIDERHALPSLVVYGRLGADRVITDRERTHGQARDDRTR